VTDPDPDRSAPAGPDRRTFLRRAGLVAGGAVAAGGVLAACAGKSPTTTFDSVIDHPAKESGIDTVVVLGIAMFGVYAPQIQFEQPFLLLGLLLLSSMSAALKVYLPLTTGGFYYRVMGRDFIAVDSKLTSVEKLLILFHELAHFLFHTPESGATANFHSVGRRTRKECEADAFALCALIPRKWIETRSPEELIDMGLTGEMVAKRLKILERYQV